MVHWLRLHTLNAGSMGLIPGQGTKIPPAVPHCPPKTEGVGLEITKEWGEVEMGLWPGTVPLFES